MAAPLSVPPGFDDLPVGDQIDFVRALWRRIAEAQRSIPSPEWHRAAVREATAAHQANPGDGQTWSETRADLESELKS